MIWITKLIYIIANSHVGVSALNTVLKKFICPFPGLSVFCGSSHMNLKTIFWLTLIQYWLLPHLILVTVDVLCVILTRTKIRNAQWSFGSRTSRVDWCIILCVEFSIYLNYVSVLKQHECWRPSTYNKMFYPALLFCDQVIALSCSTLWSHIDSCFWYKNLFHTLKYLRQ